MTTFATKFGIIMMNLRTLRLLILLAICSLCIHLNAQTDSVYDGTVHYFWTGDGNHVRYGLMDTTGNVIRRPSFSQIGVPYFDLKSEPVPAAKGRKWGFINTKGEWVVRPQFEYAGYFHNGLAMVIVKGKIEVYARGKEVELKLNGKSVGRKKLPKQSWARFKAAYEPGELTAISYDESGKEIARTSLTSAGSETKLTLLPETGTTKIGALLYVRLRYTDSAGKVKPVARGDIKVAVEGGKLIALGNACSYNDKGYQSDVTDTWYGEALAIIEPIGDVTVKAESKYGNDEIIVKCDTELFARAPTMVGTNSAEKN